jgi:hypothetical protein
MRLIFVNARGPLAGDIDLLSERRMRDQYRQYDQGPDDRHGAVSWVCHARLILHSVNHEDHEKRANPEELLRHEEHDGREDSFNAGNTGIADDMQASRPVAQRGHAVGDTRARSAPARLASLRPRDLRVSTPG